VYLYPLDPLGLARPSETLNNVQRFPAGIRVQFRSPRTVAEVLAAASEAMDEQDRRQAMRDDPVAWASAHEPRNRLWDRLFGRR
jgi:hypothetical protein